MRFSMQASLAAIAVAGLLALPLHAAPTSPEKTASPVEKLRKSLDQTKEFDIEKKGLGKAIEALAEQAGVPIELHPLDFPNYANLGAAAGGPGAPVADMWTSPELTIKGKLKVRTALKKALEPHGMTYVILEDKVYITTTDTLPQRQVKQKVSVTLDNQKFSAALKQLAKDTASNILLDPKVVKDHDNALTLELDEVTLDTAVKVLAVSSGLSSVRMGNVLFVTTTERAKELRTEAVELDPPVLPNQMLNFGGWPFGPPGFRLFNVMGFGGGQLGFGGGAFGLAGGAVPGVADPATGKAEPPKEEKKDPEKKDPKKDEPKKDESSLLPGGTTGWMSVALLGTLTFTGISAWWTRRSRREVA